MSNGRFTVNRHVLAVIENEWAQLIRNRVVIVTTLAPPLLLVALALIVLFFSSLIGSDTPQVSPTASSVLRDLDPTQSGVNNAEDLRRTLLSPFLLLFQMIPLVVPITIASYSIVGEKQNRSLEPLLSTPIHTWELLVAKALSAAVPGVMATWYGFGIFALAARFLVSDNLYNGLILSPAWILTVVLLTPLFTLLGVSLGIIISSRVKEPSSAQQLTSLVVMPLIVVLLGQVLGLVNVSTGLVLGTGLVIALLDSALLTLAVRLFRREEILTMWR